MQGKSHLYHSHAHIDIFDSKRQFDRRIREWKLEKNIKKRKATAMLKLRDKRAKDGKATEFTYKGQPVGDRLERAREVSLKYQWESDRSVGKFTVG